jgi:hypothetical protein
MILYKLAFGHNDKEIGQKIAQGGSIIQKQNLIIFRVFAYNFFLFLKKN